jgi:hypothetical protein
VAAAAPYEELNGRTDPGRSTTRQLPSPVTPGKYGTPSAKVTKDLESCSEWQGENGNPPLIGRLERWKLIDCCYCGRVVQKGEQLACELRSKT